MPRSAVKVSVIAIMAVVVCAVSAAPAQARKARLVGQANGSNAFMGVTSDGASVLVYVCDGKRISQWFSGSLRERGSTVLRNAAGARLTLRLTGSRGSGRVRLPGGRTLSVRLSAARSAVRGGPAGLFRREETEFPVGPAQRRLSGWIRLNDGRVRGLSQVVAGADLQLVPPLKVPPRTALVAPLFLPDCSPPRVDPVDHKLRPRPEVNLCRFAVTPRPAPRTSERTARAPSGATIPPGEVALISAELRRIVDTRLARIGQSGPPLRPSNRPSLLRIEDAIRSSPAAQSARSALEAALDARDALKVRDRADEIEKFLPSQAASGSQRDVRQPFPDAFPPPPPPSSAPVGLTLNPPDFAAVFVESGDEVAGATATAVTSGRLSVAGLTHGRDALAYTAASATMEVPPGVRRVSMRVVRLGITGVVNTTCLFGASSADWSGGMWMTKVLPSGEHGPSMFELVRGDTMRSECVVPSFGVPVPPTLFPAPSDARIAFTPDAAGGSYRLNVFGSSFTNIAGLGTAYADGFAGLDRVEVAFER